MHTLLEAYLDQVAAHLSALPAKRRTEELREMRQHLLNAVTVNREHGQSEEDAAANAVMQFGTPEDLGSNLVWAWQREQMLNKKSLLGAAVTTTLTLCLLFFLMDQQWFGPFLDSIMPRTFLLYLGKHPGYGTDFTQAIFMTTFGLAGIAAGSIFPKRAVRGACLGLIIFWIGFVAVDGVAYGGLWLDIFNGRTEWMLPAIISAWAGSRWQMWRTARKRLARVDHAVRTMC